VKKWEKKIVLVGLSKGTMGGRRGRENVAEWKILKQPMYICIYMNSYIYMNYNITQCIIICWILADYGDTEKVSMVGGLIWLDHNIYRPKVPKWNTLELSIIHFKK
jgi:hypothetical protein